MRFDLFYVVENPVGRSEQDFADSLEQIEHGEDLGFDGIWIAEHHGNRYGSISNPAVFAAAVAQRTKRVRIGPAVSVLPFHHPVTVAEDYALVDVLSGGRLEFGCGRGYQPSEFELFGVDPSKSRPLFQESIDIIRGVWDNETFSHSGEFYEIKDFSLNPRPVQEKIPLWTVASTAESYPMAARNGLKILTQASVRQTVDELKENVRVARSIYQESGIPEEDFGLAINIPIHIAEDAEQARAEARDHLAWQFKQMRALSPGAGGGEIPEGYESYARYGQSEAGDSDSPWSFESLNESKVVLVGDPDDARRHVAALQDEIGVDHIICFMRFGGMDHDSVIRSMDLWAKEVMPAFSGTVASGANSTN